MKKAYYILASLLIILLISASLVLNRSIRPYQNMRKAAFHHAETYLDLQTRENFYIYHGNDASYLTVTGLLRNGHHVIAIINQNTGQIDLFRADDIVNEAEAVDLFQKAMPEAELIQARIGKDDHFVWEICFRNDDQTMGYYYINLENGQWIKTINKL